jgi:hypothetical protein
MRRHWGSDASDAKKPRALATLMMICSNVREAFGASQQPRAQGSHPWALARQPEVLSSKS